MPSWLPAAPARSAAPVGSAELLQRSPNVAPCSSLSRRWGLMAHVRPHQLYSEQHSTPNCDSYGAVSGYRLCDSYVAVSWCRLCDSYVAVPWCRLCDSYVALPGYRLCDSYAAAPWCRLCDSYVAVPWCSVAAICSSCQVSSGSCRPASQVPPHLLPNWAVNISPPTCPGRGERGGACGC